MIFNDVRYHLGSTLPEESRDQLDLLLREHGGTRADSVFDAIYIITNSEAFEGWRDVKPGVHIVSELWVERSIAAGKIQKPSFYSTSPSQLFSGVVAASTPDLRLSDEEVISAGIQSLGGQWRMGLTKDVTHLFAMSPTSDRYMTAMSYREQTRIKVLVPDWFDDTVLLGLPGLSTDKYEWPDPAVLQRRPGIPTTPKRSKQEHRASLSPEKRAFYRTASWDPSQPPLETKDVWEGRRILLSTTLELTGSRRRIVEEGIRKAKGVCVKYTLNEGDGTSAEELRLLNSCDVFVTRYRTGPAFFKVCSLSSSLGVVYLTPFEAWRADKTIGTLSWLLNVQFTGIRSSPMDQLLHFPIPPGVVKGFDQHEISVTNYTGEARDYLKKLITLMGGNFTPSFSNKNTVLVAAQLSGSKTDKARTWSVTVVNHVWLEDCFLNWKSMTPALQKYISYPAGVDFAQILGEQGVGPDIRTIIAREAAEEGELAEGADDSDPRGSQNSADETEVEGGLMPPVDMDVDFGEDGRDERVLEDYEPPQSSRPESSLRKSSPVNSQPSPMPSRRSRPRSSIRKSATSQPSPKKDEPMPSEDDEPPRRSRPGPAIRKSSPIKSQPSPKKFTRGLSLSSDVDPELKDKVVYVPRHKSAAKTALKSKTADSEGEATSEDEPVVVRPPRKALVRRVTRRSPRKLPDSPQEQASTSKLDDIDSNDSDLDDLPVELAPLTKAPKSLPASNTIKVARASTSKRPPPSKRNVTPTPPSSPLSAPPTASPKVVRRVPTAIVSVVVPHVKLSASAKKATPARTESMTMVSHHRAASGSASVSAPPRSRVTDTSTTRASSPASSVVAAPAGNGRTQRSAAQHATKRLHDVIMPDVVNFQNEQRNRGRKGGRRSSGRMEEEAEEEDEAPMTKRRKVERERAPTSDAESTVFELPVRPKARKSEVAMRNGKPIKLMTTGFDLSDDVLKALAELGAKVTSRPVECTHLVVKNLVRTEKFLSALSGAPYILSETWAVESAAAHTLLPEDDYLLQDAAAEKKYGFKLSEAVARAKEHKGKLFQGHTFFVTPKVNAAELLRRVVQANGGQALINQQPTSRMLETNPGRHVISCVEDKALWQHLAATHVIYTTEVVLAGALLQDVDWEEYRLEGSD
ncbi:hypothetical protein C8R43DRAFT_652591 [Mycena crocata]|nr:hypothetical protein C8R43DRAFT_652591 [Mycena crocata]